MHNASQTKQNSSDKCQAPLSEDRRFIPTTVDCMSLQVAQDFFLQRLSKQ